MECVTEFYFTHLLLFLQNGQGEKGFEDLVNLFGRVFY